MIQQDIGNKINQLRNENNMTLKDLAEKCNLSIAFLSQIERGLASPALISLDSIANALGVDLSYFFSIPNKEYSIITRSYEQVPFIAKHSNYIYNELSQHIEGSDLEVMMVTLIPGAEENYPVIGSHVGEEFIYILEGTLTLLYDNNSYDLFPGDSAHYKADLPHTWRNNTTKLVKVLSVNTPVSLSKN